MIEVLHNHRHPIFPEEQNIQQEYRTLIEQSWSKTPDDRPTFEEIYSKLTPDRNYLVAH